MAKQKGRALLIKIDDGTGTSTFTNLCGLTTKTLTVNNNAFEVTTPDQTTPGQQLWREVMTGIRSVSVSGNGYFEDTAAEELLRAVALGTGESDTADAIDTFQIVVPDFGTFEGDFHVDSIEYGGEQENGVTYSVALSSSGAITFTAA